MIGKDWGPVGALVLTVIADYPGPVASDMRRLCDSQKYRSIAFHGRYGAVFLWVSEYVADGGIVEIGDFLARCESARLSSIEAGRERKRRERMRHTGRTEALPTVSAGSAGVLRRGQYRGIRSAAPGKHDPGLVTTGSVGGSPAKVAAIAAETAFWRDIGRAVSRAASGARPGNKAPSGYYTAAGAYCGGQRKPRKRR